MRLPFEVVQNTSRAKVTGETRNMSSSGVLFTAGPEIQVGRPIEYLITFPKAAGARTSVQLRCLGTVVRQGQEASLFAATLERYEFRRE